jgi:hypothetical protein
MNNGCTSKNSPGSNIVAKYGNDNYVTIKELNKYIKDWMYFKKYRSREDIYKNALNDLLVNQFKRIDFFEKGLDKDKKLIQNINRVINEELVNEYFETQYLGKYVTEEEAKKVYEIMNKEVIYQLIELNKPENASQKQLDSLKEKTLTIKSDIENGKTFNSFVKKYSQNKISLMNNGYMPPVDWKQSILNPLSNIIFHLNENDIRVLNSNTAFMIVKIANVDTLHVEPFDSIKSNIISDLKKVYAEVSLDEYNNDIKDLLDENSLRWDETALKQIVKWSRIPNFFKSEYKKTFTNAITNGNNKTILSYNGGTVDYKEFLRLLDNVLIIKDFQGMKEEDIRKYIREAIRTDLIVKKAEALDLRQNIFNAFTTDVALRSQILYLYNQAEIEAKLPRATDEALHSFFKENENTLYYQLEKRNLFVMVFSTKKAAEKALRKIHNGTPFEKVTGRYLVKTYIKERTGEIKSYGDDEKNTFSKIGFKMEESEIIGPEKFEDENNESKYAVIKCSNIRPEKQLTYDDVKNTIQEDFKNYYRRKIDEDIQERLKIKYNPVINQEVLAKLISTN